MPLGGMPHGQDVVGEEGRLVPGGRQSDVAPHRILVLQHLDPGESVRVGPHRVEYPGEVDVHRAPPVLDQVRQYVAHLVVREGVLGREVQLVPAVRVRGHVEQLGLELGPGVWRSPPLGSNAARQDVQ